MGKAKVRAIAVIGRRWFQKTNGNTYHSVAIYVNNEFVFRNPYECGYGNHWEQTAQEWLEKNGYLPGLEKYQYGGSELLSVYCVNRGIKYVRDVTNVQRKKDL